MGVGGGRERDRERERDKAWSFLFASQWRTGKIWQSIMNHHKCHISCTPIVKWCWNGKQYQRGGKWYARANQSSSDQCRQSLFLDYKKNMQLIC